MAKEKNVDPKRVAAEQDERDRKILMLSLHAKLYRASRKNAWTIDTLKRLYGIDINALEQERRDKAIRVEAAAKSKPHRSKIKSVPTLTAAKVSVGAKMVTKPKLTSPIASPTKACVIQQQQTVVVKLSKGQRHRRSKALKKQSTGVPSTQYQAPTESDPVKLTKSQQKKKKIRGEKLIERERERIEKSDSSYKGLNTMFSLPSAPAPSTGSSTPEPLVFVSRQGSFSSSEQSWIPVGIPSLSRHSSNTLSHTDSSSIASARNSDAGVISAGRGDRDDDDDGGCLGFWRDVRSELGSCLSECSKSSAEGKDKLEQWQNMCIELGIARPMAPFNTASDTSTDDWDVESNHSLAGSDRTELAVPFVPQTLTGCIKLLKERGHVNLRDYLEQRKLNAHGQGSTAMHGLVFPSAAAMKKYTRKSGKFLDKKIAKSELLQPLMRDFHHERSES